MSDAAQRWQLAQLAFRCLAQDPRGLGGIVIRARVGPARDALMAQVAMLPQPHVRIHPDVSDAQLFGGTDIAATLSAGTVVDSTGVLGQAGTLVLGMAERCGAGLAARLAQHLDLAEATSIVALDEGAGPDETTPMALSQRLAFHVDLDGLALSDLDPAALPTPDSRNTATLPDDAAETLVSLAARFGIADARAVLMALRCARAHAALFGRQHVGADDMAAAATLVFPSRATMLPEDPDQAPPPDTSAETSNPDTPDSDTDMDIPDADMMVAAVKAMLPSGLLERLAAGQAARGTAAGGGGQRRRGNRRGRPMPSRPGRPDGRARIDLVATLRAAAPWQPLRRKTQPKAIGLLLRVSDLRLRRFEEKSDRLLIFTVDASGSAAVSRLNEAKGAVELLLADAYARRDNVALIAFRGTGAELLLPPTRSLVQTKRRLAGLPGGGATPLAAGLKQALDLARSSRAKGLSPTVVIMTDGRANIALDGTADRPRAAEDGVTLARLLRGAGVPGLVIDMSNRPQQALQTLALSLDAPYLPLPRADAHKVSAAVAQALPGD